MRNMLLVDEICCVDPVEYLAKCKENNSLDSIKLAFEKFSVDKVENFYSDFKEFKSRGQAIQDVYMLKLFDDYVGYANALCKEISVGKRLKNQEDVDDYIKSILSDCQFVPKDSHRSFVVDYLKVESNDDKVRQYHDKLFCKDFAK